jgi:radical SAM protein with 4Fe4S-binding SPASM domain
MDYDPVFNRLIRLHAFFPYYLFGGKALPPFRIKIETTYSCNLRCPYCYQDDEYKKEKEEFSFDEIKNLLRQIPSFSLVTLTGGEPFYRKDFPDILQFALDNHWCTLLSNCALLSKENIHQMVDGGLLLLGASIDGIGKLHDELRGGKIFDKIVDNLKYLQRYKKERGKKFPQLDIKTVMLAQNVSSLPDVYQLAEELDADYFTLSLPKVSEVQFNPRLFADIDNPIFYEKIDAKLSVDKDVFGKSLTQICKRAAGNGPKVRFYPRVQDARMFDMLFDSTMLMTDKYAACHEPWSGMNISAKGEVYPCLSYRMGSVKETTLQAVWNSPRYKSFRNRLKSLKLFPACEGCCFLRVNYSGK